MADKKAVRTKMSDADVEKFLHRYQKERDLRDDEFKRALRHCAATRWAALERYVARHEKPVKKGAKRAA